MFTNTRVHGLYDMRREPGHCRGPTWLRSLVAVPTAGARGWRARQTGAMLGERRGAFLTCLVTAFSACSGGPAEPRAQEGDRNLYVAGSMVLAMNAATGRLDPMHGFDGLIRGAVLAPGSGTLYVTLRSPDFTQSLVAVKRGRGGTASIFFGLVELPRGIPLLWMISAFRLGG